MPFPEHIDYLSNYPKNLGFFPMNRYIYRTRIPMQKKNDEILIRLHDSMTEAQIATELTNCSNALHRLIQISIDAGARAHLTYFTHLINAAAAAESSAFILMQANQQQSGIVRPQ
jgi:hypothetical protein